MNNSSMQDSLELEVTDFGPIAKAKVDLRPLTVFVGPSNTGKSWLAILIYALHRYFSADAGLGRRGYRGRYRTFRFGVGEKPSQAVIDALSEWAKQTFANRQKPFDTGSIVLPGPVADEIRSGFDEQGEFLGNEIIRCFGAEGAGGLVRKGSRDNAHILLRRSVAKNAEPVEHRLTFGAHAPRFETAIPKGTAMQIEASDGDRIINYLGRGGLLWEADRPGEGLDFEVWRLMETLAGLALPHLVAPLERPAFYLPADRTGVMHAHSVVVSALIESASMAGLRPAARTPMLSGVLADFLERLIELDHLPYPQRKPRHDLGTPIENAVLGGKVRIDRSKATGYPRFTYRPDGWTDDLPLMNSSSMVSELAPVVLYLRHVIEPGNLLIVEEPESHLHPAMQVEFTRQIAALVRSGVRILLTTHSEWVLEALANLVQRSGLPESEREGTGGEGIALEPDQVGVWLFQPHGRTRGSAVTEIHLDDSDLYPSGFNEVAAALHNGWAEISSRIGEAE